MLKHKPQQPELDPDEYLSESVRIEPAAISEEFVRLPSDYAYWNEMYRRALEAHLRAEAESERIEALLYVAESAKNHPTTAKPVTVDYVKAQVTGNAAYQKARAEEITAEVEVVRLKGVMEALRTKREMLISLGATMRQELEHDPLIREHAAKSRR